MQKDNWYEGKICAKYGGTSFTYGMFTPNPRELWWIFFFFFTFYNVFLGNRTFEALLFDFLGDKIRNSNVLLRMCFRMCFRECVSANVFRICF